MFRCLRTLVERITSGRMRRDRKDRRKIGKIEDRGHPIFACLQLFFWIGRFVVHWRGVNDNPTVIAD
jgi:hypothetical protein